MIENQKNEKPPKTTYFTRSRSQGSSINNHISPPPNLYPTAPHAHAPRPVQDQSSSFSFFLSQWVLSRVQRSEVANELWCVSSDYCLSKIFNSFKQFLYKTIHALFWVALYSVIFSKFHGLKVDILGTQSLKHLQVKGLQTGLFKGSWLPNVKLILQGLHLC